MSDRSGAKATGRRFNSLPSLHGSESQSIRRNRKSAASSTSRTVSPTAPGPMTNGLARIHHATRHAIHLGIPHVIVEPAMPCWSGAGFMVFRCLLMDRKGVQSLRSDDRPQLSAGGRRRLVASLASLAAAAAVLLGACGNADHKVSDDTRPDPRASTEGAQPAYPAPIASDSLAGTASPADGIPPEDLVSQAGFGQRDDK